MTPVEELFEQRDAVLFGEWVKYPPQPEQPGQACLLVTSERRKLHQDMELECSLGYVSVRAEGFVIKALDAMFPQRKSGAPDNWNDCECPDKETALMVLDEAIRMAKADE